MEIFRFLEVPGIMSSQIRQFDWSKTSLGGINLWPVSFRSQVFIMLNHPFPMMLLKGKDLHILYNDAYIPFLGSQEQENPCLGQKSMEFYSSNWDQYKTIIHEVLKTGKSFKAEHIQWPDPEGGINDESYFTFTYSPIMNDEEKIDGIIITLIETSTYIESLKKIKDQEIKINLAMEASGIGFFELIIGNNEINEFIFSDSFLNLIPLKTNPNYEDIVKIIHPEDFPLGLNAFEEALSTGIFYYTPRIITGGRIRYIQVKGKIVPSDSGFPYVLLGTVRDITDKKVQDDKLNHSHKLLNKSLVEQVRLQKEKEEFLQVASHELRTPLTSIKGYGQLVEELVRERILEDEALMLQKLNERISHLHSLVENLFDVSKIHSQKMDFTNTVFDLVSLLERKVEDLRFITYEHKIIEEYLFKASLLADPDRISQVINNLLTNAVKYSLKGTEILVRSLEYPGHIAVEIHDQGVGIPPHELHKIFDHFYRSPNPSNPMIRGLGLGLYLSSKIIQKQGGKIWAESKVGKGSKFVFILPTIQL